MFLSMLASHSQIGSLVGENGPVREQQTRGKNASCLVKQEEEAGGRGDGEED